MKRLVGILLVAAIVAAILLSTLVVLSKGTTSSSVASIQVTSLAASRVIDRLPSEFALAPDQVEVLGKVYQCTLPWWMEWLCRALNSKQCPSCYIFVA